ncbi:MAG: hypothetical protein AVDCRST_MAG14-300 [uncultured Rubrobacteraceae bacterium]|uniref:Uncharacterized protein n=1 Tax=uncultured Rubrobacteraceae bacterium TaxID=349277 RepID=A0A6J4QHG1_9ACTN|nr:MAG: hypothetical protein AVDCRST_MAG14-300 [uncultured Rubrobacteraceae bacterium]
MTQTDRRRPDGRPLNLARYRANALGGERLASGHGDHLSRDVW